jgi:hypothetical protein
MFRKLILICIIVLINIFCNINDLNTELNVSILSSKLVLSNQTTNIYYYVVMGRNIVGIGDWAIGCDLSNQILPNTIKEILFDNIPKDSLDSTFVVYYWQKEMDGMPCTINIKYTSIKFK